jgi:CheY-like chemotaxis protein
MTRVLVVDDEPSVRQILIDVMDSVGHEVAAATNGAEAMDQIRQWRPDAVLLDLMMPDVDGWDFLAEYRLDPQCRGIPLAVLSAAPNAMRALDEPGVLAVVPKPFELNGLLDTVESLIKHSAVRLPAHSRAFATYGS